MDRIFCYSFAAERLEGAKPTFEHTIWAIVDSDPERVQKLAPQICLQYFPELRGYYNHSIIAIEIPVEFISKVIGSIARLN